MSAVFWMHAGEERNWKSRRFGWFCPLSNNPPSPSCLYLSISVCFWFSEIPRNSHFAYAIVQEENTLLYNLCSNCWISRRRYFWTGSERNSVTVGGSKNVLVNMDLLVFPVAFVETLYLILYYLHQTRCREQRFLSPAIEIHPLSQKFLVRNYIVGKFKLVLFSCNWFKTVSNWQLILLYMHFMISSNLHLLDIQMILFPVQFDSLRFYCDKF